MKLKLIGIAVAALVSAVSVAQADQLADIRKAGVLRAAVFDANAPFGSIDPKTKELVGYDIDFAKEFAKDLGVKLELVTTNPANRIPLLTSGKVDLIVADITITPERAQVIDFTIPYFVSGQQLLVPSASSTKLADYAAARVAAVKGTTGEQQYKTAYPQAKVVSFDDLPLAFAALRAGNVQAVTQDGTVLVGLLDETPDKDKYKILSDLLSREEIGIGVKKGEKALFDEVEKSLLKIESSGKATEYFEKWFGKGAKTPQTREFKITPHS